MMIKEFRIIMPMTVEEYHVAQLWSVAEVSKNETGGGEGIEVVKNEPFDTETNPPETPLTIQGQTFDKGQYTYKIYYLDQKVPTFIRYVAPKGSLEITEKAWNAYPYCRTVLENPNYMAEKFFIKVESMHILHDWNIENIHELNEEQLAMREIVYIDIANDLVEPVDYKSETDPQMFQSQKTGRGPLLGPRWWEDTNMPIMCCYKLVTCDFKWWGLQTRVENMIMNQEQRIFRNFSRQVFCWIDRWHGLSMVDIRRLEEETKNELIEQRRTGEVRGTMAA